MSEIGDRVGAILRTNDGVVDLIGYGVYVGRRIPKEAVGYMAEMAVEFGVENPCIELDRGGVVYGCECWWGPEDRIKKEIQEQNLRIKEVDINKVREEYSRSGEI